MRANGAIESAVVTARRFVDEAHEACDVLLPARPPNALCAAPATLLESATAHNARSEPAGDSLDARAGGE